MIFLTPRQCQKLDFDILNNSAICFVRFRLSRRYGCILEDFRIIATPNSLYFSRMYLFSTKFIKKSFFYLNFEHFSALKAVFSTTFFNTANLIKTSQLSKMSKFQKMPKFQSDVKFSTLYIQNFLKFPYIYLYLFLFSNWLIRQIKVESKIYYFFYDLFLLVNF